MPSESGPGSPGSPECESASSAFDAAGRRASTIFSAHVPRKCGAEPASAIRSRNSSGRVIRTEPSTVAPRATKASGSMPTVGPTTVTRASGRASASRSSSVSLSNVVPVISSTSALRHDFGRRLGRSVERHLFGLQRRRVLFEHQIGQSPAFQFLQERDEGADQNDPVAVARSPSRRTRRRRPATRPPASAGGASTIRRARSLSRCRQRGAARCRTARRASARRQAARRGAGSRRRAPIPGSRHRPAPRRAASRSSAGGAEQSA